MYKDFPFYYYNEVKHSNCTSDQFYFYNEHLTSDYYKQYQYGVLGYEGFLYTYLKGNLFNDLIYPTTLSFQHGESMYHFNDGAFYLVIDLRDKE